MSILPVGYHLEMKRKALSLSYDLFRTNTILISSDKFQLCEQAERKINLCHLIKHGENQSNGELVDC